MKRFVLYLINAQGRRILRRFDPVVVGVTGSVGKTTTKDAIYYAIRGQRRTLRAIGSQNSQWGVYLALVGYEKKSGAYERLRVSELLRAFWQGRRILRGDTFAEVVVLEYGADHPGDIHYLASYYQPDVAVVTNIGPSHLANFSDQQAIAAEKGELVRSLKPDGRAVLNRDDPLVQKIGASFAGRVFWYGVEGGDLAAEKIESRPEGVSYSLKTPTGSLPVKLPVRGGSGIFASLAALGVAEALGLDLKRSIAALRDFTPASGRLEVKRAKGYTIIDDTYNASPASMRSALEYLSGFSGRKVAVLGEMRELGAISGRAHREVGALAAQSADLVVVVGEGARGMLEGAKKAMFIPTIEQAETELPTIFQRGDTVLFKASRGVALERLVRSLGGGTDAT